MMIRLKCLVLEVIRITISVFSLLELYYLVPLTVITSKFCIISNDSVIITILCCRQREMLESAQPVQHLYNDSLCWDLYLKKIDGVDSP